jgi:hypothetical protein
MGNLLDKESHSRSGTLATLLRVLLVEDDENDVELLRLAFKSVLAPQLSVAFNDREAADI